MYTQNTKNFTGRDIATISPVAIFYGRYRDDVPNLSGTVALASNGNLTGTGTKFQDELKVGDYIYIEGESKSRKVLTIASGNTQTATLSDGKVISGGKTIKKDELLYMGGNDGLTYKKETEKIAITYDSAGPLDEVNGDISIDLTVSFTELGAERLAKLDDGYNIIYKADGSIDKIELGNPKIGIDPIEYRLKVVKTTKKLSAGLTRDEVEASLSTDPADTMNFLKVRPNNSPEFTFKSNEIAMAEYGFKCFPGTYKTHIGKFNVQGLL